MLNREVTPVETSLLERFILCLDPAAHVQRHNQPTPPFSFRTLPDSTRYDHESALSQGHQRGQQFRHKLNFAEDQGRWEICQEQIGILPRSIEILDRIEHDHFHIREEVRQQGALPHLTGARDEDRLEVVFQVKQLCLCMSVSVLH